MRLFRTCLVAPLVLVLSLPHHAFPQVRHAVDPSELAAVVSGHAEGADAARTVVREALDRPEVRRVAEALGLDAGQLLRSAGTLEGADLERAASAAQEVSDALVGGQSTVVISTTTIIIILLLVIVIVAVAD
jgi:hypothetical protein